MAEIDISNIIVNKKNKISNTEDNGFFDRINDLLNKEISLGRNKKPF